MFKPWLRRARVWLPLVVLCLAPSFASAQTTALFLDSQQGDPVGGGQQRIYLPPGLEFTSSGFGREISVTVRSPYSATTYVSWGLRFRTAAARVVPGVYENVHGTSGPLADGMSVSGGGHCSGDVTGRFTVLEADYAADGRVVRFAADFEQHCNDRAPALFGTVRVNSTIATLTPFGGAYPRYSLRITPPAHGTVSGDGVDCGIGGAVCTLALEASVEIELTATPEPGYVFLGWTGSCLGGTTISVNVNAPRSCDALFGPEPPSAPRTVLRLDGEIGSVASGLHETLAGEATQWRLSRYDTSTVVVEVTLPNGATRRFEMGLPNGDLVPGTYEAASSAWAHYDRPRLSASVSDGSYCSPSARGRFVLHELVVDPSGTVVRLAADLEYHCGDAIPALYAAIRYNSAHPGSEPFGGAYPRYDLTVTRPLHGQVTGGSLACGSSGSQCAVTLSSGGPVTLTAVPDAGYIFIGWNSNCSGGPTTTVVVSGPTVCSAEFEPTAPSGPRLLIILESEPGDLVGGGRRATYSAANANVQVSSSGNGVSLNVDGNDGSDWRFTLQSGGAGRLAPGTYADLGNLYGFLPALSVNCSSTISTGRFVVHEITFGAAGTLLSLAFDFEQHCNDATPGLFGVVRYNSTVPGVVPFAGAYPDYRLTVSADAGGRVTGGGFDCAGSTGTCERVYPGPAGVGLTAVASAGHVFTGWGGSCTGGTVTFVNVNGPKSCRATFEPAAPTAPRSLLVVDSKAGDSIGQGRRTVHSAANSRWTVTTAQPGYVAFRVETVDGYWRLDFAAPGTSGVLAPGLYVEARRAPFRDSAPGLDITSSHRGCNTVEGRFLVQEIAFNADGTLARFSADFEQHCSGQDPGLFGAVRYASTVPAVEPWGGAYPIYRLSIGSALNGTVTGAGMQCGTGGTACETTRTAIESVIVEARADRGYVFAGWNGACAGAGAAASVRLYGARDCTPLFLPIATTAPVTVLAVDYVDSAAKAQSRRYHSGNATWPLMSNGQTDRITVLVRGLDRADWLFTLVAPTSQALTRGLYRVSNTVSGAASVSNSNCSQPAGTVVVHELATSGTQVQRLAVDFRLSCGSGSTRTPMTGIVRFNSRITPRPLSWGTHRIVSGTGASGGPHVLAADSAARVDPFLNFLAYDGQFTGGVSVSSGDVDGDGAADIVTAPSSAGGPHVRVITSSPAGPGQPAAARELASFMAYAPDFMGGITVAVGDVTGDGIADIVTGMGRGGAPEVRVFQLQQSAGGIQAVERARFLAYDAALTSGIRVAVGDVDGDGVGEIITAPGAGGGPHVMAYRLHATGVSAVTSFFAYDPQFYGGVFVAAGDINGDGVDEIITGTDTGGGPHVLAITRLADGRLTLLANFFAYDAGFTGGVRVGAGDLDGDGRAEIITGAGPGGGPHVIAVRRADDATLSYAASFFAYDPRFTGGVFVAGATR